MSALLFEDCTDLAAPIAWREIPIEIVSVSPPVITDTRGLLDLIPSGAFLEPAPSSSALSPVSILGRVSHTASPRDAAIFISTPNGEQ
jgi:hypothetical protein